ncbi:acylneuraminate cytidylyltransferase family protein [Schaedlerella arabinosiphila]|uniref:Acylneuraminate cytidylyltransferase family protein n=1 Tax=Schaedlerella arabinosiphila TaxID=2044587 RepID=A0A9X5C6A6_9FIRM|nr:acylneuraminate cytidylyltransferase family protein [Schaedlerella arabinosiphila]KAI4443437.1 CMP-N,N'-diacetyllegionaminic acid synthase [Schaedlerella arabinosiphila]NDO68835.1 acylneuraminate cytidylyltransferase family protein [Schaedlerella arabinosiphila]
MNILFTICGRAGSKGFQNKNLKEMNGVPLLYYTIAAIRLFMDNHKEDNIIVALNTDSIQLQELVERQNIIENIFFIPRKIKLAGDIVAKVDVIKDTYLTFRPNKRFDVVIDLDITSPLRRVEDIERVLDKYLSDKSYDLVFSVVEARRNPYFNMVEEKAGGNYKKVCESVYTARQQAPNVYELNASIYAYRPEFLQSEIKKPILDYNYGIVQMPDFLVLDIDSERDFFMMEYLHRIYCKKEIGINLIYNMASNCKRNA